jgi:hypothetical protein
LVVALPHPGLAVDVSFAGRLERVGNQSISIRLTDRRVICALLPKTPMLSPEALAVQYRTGDQVKITCKPIQPVWERGTSRLQYLEVTAIQLLGRPSAGQLAEILSERLFREGENLLDPDSVATAPIGDSRLSGPGSDELEHARETNLQYVSHLPNFVADETQKRYKSSTASPEWSRLDTIETEITFHGNGTVRRQIRRDGKPWKQPFESLPGFKWYGGFGSEIKPLFDPQCPTTIEYQGRSEMGPRQLLEYRYSTPIDGCFPFFYFHYQRYNPARTGHVFIDSQSGNVLQLDEDAIGFPSEFELAERQEQISWESVKIGEDSHLLPVRATCLAVFGSGARYRIEVEFKNHRHFEASSNVTFH